MNSPAAQTGSKLYTPQLLGLAASLYNHPLDERAMHIGEARSRTCGSAITVGIDCDEEGTITHIGMAVKACAIGQGSAALLAENAAGQTAEDIARAVQHIKQWLGGKGELPDWPGFEALASALPHPGRHGALLIPWTAANQALSSTPCSS